MCSFSKPSVTLIFLLGSKNKLSTVVCGEKDMVKRTLTGTGSRFSVYKVNERKHFKVNLDVHGSLSVLDRAQFNFSTL